MNFRRKETAHDSSPEDANHAQARLAEVTAKIEELETEASMLFERKKQGMLHDGEYNISVSYIGQRLDTLRKEQSDLLKRIDKVQGNLARKAFGA